MNKDKQKELVNIRLKRIRAYKAIFKLPEWESVRSEIGQDIQSCLNSILGELKDMVDVAEKRGAIKAYKKIISSIDSAVEEEKKILKEYEKFK